MKKKQKPKKQYIVRKYIIGTSVSDVLKREKNFKADDCYLDDKWIDQHFKELSPAIGFSVEKDYEEDY